MSTQTPDRLDYDGNIYWVDGLVDLPPGFRRPPSAVLPVNTGSLRGFNCRWEIRDHLGTPCLFLSGIERMSRKHGEYQPLDKPILNPISRTLTVVQGDEEPPDFGFIDPELLLRFEDGQFVGMTPISENE